jgi:nucleoside 2-deoxyribosyltransferase
MKLYLAGPLFTLAEQRFNEHLAGSLRMSMVGLDIILPQERAKLFLGKPGGLDLVFEDCLAMIDACDAVLAILDGADADSGTCIELGYAWARRKPVVGVRTDFRISEDRGLNLMVSHVCQALLVQSSEDLESLSKKICAALGQICASKHAPPAAAARVNSSV